MTAKLLRDGAPRMLDRYELIAELASGGMATVYLARLGGLAGFQRLFAIKHLHPYLHGDRQFVQMFLDEARLAAGIHHPHVVPILEVGTGDEGYYIVMEYVEGDTLARLLARASSVRDDPVPIEISISVMLHTLEGLEAAHALKDDYGNSLNLVHRDVSPQNILVGVDGVTRLTDFGVARAASRLNATKAGQLKGKLAYMAPEQARSGEVDPRTDVFAAGIVLWEALTMRRLFRGPNDAATLNNVLFEPIEPVSTFNPAVPPSIEQVVARALQRDPDARFRSCAAFGDALEGAARDEGRIVNERTVAKFVQSTLGQEIQAQRDKVRAWLARSEPSQAWPVVADGAPAAEPGPHGPPVVVPSFAAGLPGPVDPASMQAVQVQRPSRRWWLVAGLGLAAAGGLGALAVLLVSRGHPPAPVEAPAASATMGAIAEPVGSMQPADSREPPAPPTTASASAQPEAAEPVPTRPPNRRPPPTVRKKLPSEKDDLATNPYR